MLTSNVEIGGEMYMESVPYGLHLYQSVTPVVTPRLSYISSVIE